MMHNPAKTIPAAENKEKSAVTGVDTVAMTSFGTPSYGTPSESKIVVRII